MISTGYKQGESGLYSRKVHGEARKKSRRLVTAKLSKGGKGRKVGEAGG